MASQQQNQTSRKIKNKYVNDGDVEKTLNSVGNILADFRGVLESDRTQQLFEKSQPRDVTDKYGVPSEFSEDQANSRLYPFHHVEQRDFKSPSSSQTVKSSFESALNPKSSFNSLLAFPNSQECSSMTVEHIRTKGKLYGPAAVSAIAGVSSSSRPQKVDRVKMTGPRLRVRDKTASLLVRPTPTQSKEEIELKRSDSALHHGRSRTSSAKKNYTVGKRKPKSWMIKYGGAKKTGDNEKGENSEIKPSPIGWKSDKCVDNSEVGGNSNPTLRYSSGRKSSTFQRRIKYKPKTPKTKRSLEELNVPTRSEVTAMMETYDDNSNPIDYSYSYSKPGKEEGRHEQWVPITAPLAHTSAKKKNRRKIKNRGHLGKIKTANSKEITLASCRARPLGPKIEGINAEVEIYSCDPSVSLIDLALTPSPIRIIRTTVLPIPQGKHRSHV